MKSILRRRMEFGEVRPFLQCAAAQRFLERVLANGNAVLWVRHEPLLLSSSGRYVDLAAMPLLACTASAEGLCNQSELNSPFMPPEPSLPPPVPPTQPAPTPPPTPPKKRRWFLYGCGAFLALILLIIATIFITLWWIQRPIKPVVLSPKEKAVADAKVQRLENESPPAPTPRNKAATGSTPLSTRGPETVELPPILPPPSAGTPDRTYVPGAKAIRLTEREINGLLNANTDLGNSVRIEFARDAINAYLAVPIPKDFPVMGGKMFRARGRFRVSLGNGGEPCAILEDVTVFGVSLPQAWLGGLKGQNLIGDALGEKKGSPVLRGIKSLRVEPGALVLELQD